MVTLFKQRAFWSCFIILIISSINNVLFVITTFALWGSALTQSHLAKKDIFMEIETYEWIALKKTIKKSLVLNCSCICICFPSCGPRDKDITNSTLNAATLPEPVMRLWRWLSSISPSSLPHFPLILPVTVISQSRFLWGWLFGLLPIFQAFPCRCTVGAACAPASPEFTIKTFNCGGRTSRLIFC